MSKCLLWKAPVGEGKISHPKQRTANMNPVSVGIITNKVAIQSIRLIIQLTEWTNCFKKSKLLKHFKTLYLVSNCQIVQGEGDLSQIRKMALNLDPGSILCTLTVIATPSGQWRDTHSVRRSANYWPTCSHAPLAGVPRLRARGHEPQPPPAGTVRSACFTTEPKWNGKLQ